jgi:Rap guanine nucleotide exchange factor 1
MRGVSLLQVHLALKHLKDVVSKNKLEMLPGNGTIVLEIVTNIVANLRNYFIDEQRYTRTMKIKRKYSNIGVI